MYYSHRKNYHFDYRHHYVDQYHECQPLVFAAQSAICLNVSRKDPKTRQVAFEEAAWGKYIKKWWKYLQLVLQFVAFCHKLIEKWKLHLRNAELIQAIDNVCLNNLVIKNLAISYNLLKEPGQESRLLHDAFHIHPLTHPIVFTQILTNFYSKNKYLSISGTHGATSNIEI